MTAALRFIGLISGTSADGIDAAIIEYDGQHDLRQIAFSTFAYSDELRHELVSVINAGKKLTPAQLGSLDARVGDAFAQAAVAICKQADIGLATVTAIGSHGQTIYHAADQEPPFSIQLGDPNRISWQTDRPVVADFRRMDLAAGGQAAPLAPLIHERLFRSSATNRVIVNLGGIANLTWLPADTSLPTTGFDTGPASCLMDAWCLQHCGEQFDANGTWATSGTVIPELLKTLLEDPYFSKPPPKSTGREYFNTTWITTRYPQLTTHSPADVQATLLALTCQTLSQAITSTTTGADIIVCGGGVHNSALLNQLRTMHRQQKVCTTAALDYDPEAIEALLFAWLAAARINEQPINTGAITGAQRPLLLGNLFKNRR